MTIQPTVSVFNEDYDILGHYIPLAWRTVNKDLDDNNLRMMLSYGLVGELGEVIDLFKKHQFHNHDLDRTKVVKECGDVLWYLACIVQYMNTTRTQWMKECLAPVYKWKISPDLKAITRYEVPLGSVDFKRTDMLLDCNMYANNIVGTLTTRYPKTLYVNRKRNSSYIGIVLYVIKNVLAYVNCSLQECLDVNVAKLKARYPDGFDAVLSSNRKEGDV